MHFPINYSIIYNSQCRETIWVSIDRQMDKYDVIHIYNGILFSHKKLKPCHCIDMDGPRGYFAKGNKSENQI